MTPQETTKPDDPERLAGLLSASRSRRSKLDECRIDVREALSLVAHPGPSLVTAVRVAGVRVARA